jgi:hypothetical protein
MENSEPRGYVFVNTALSSIQKGVQGAHAVVELFNDPIARPSYSENILKQWGYVDKTLIFLDGGFHQTLLDNYNLTFKPLCDQLELPHAIFREDEETMNEMVTAFAAVVPNYVYNLGEEYSEDEMNVLNPTPDIALCNFLSQFRLAI